jgi:hypothetical protein
MVQFEGQILLTRKSPEVLASDLKACAALIESLQAQRENESE